MIDRRKHTRYTAQNGTFALLRSTSIELSKIQDMSMGEIGFAVIKSKPVKMGQIINISTNGLAFDYIERRGKSISVFKLDILFAQNTYHLGKLLFKPVFDYAIDSEIPLNSFTIRRCGVQFGELTAHQKSRLEYFLKKHTELPISGFKTSDCVRGQGIPRIESGAYTLVREHFNSRDNAAIGHKMGL
jgi:hypothetical protein